MALRILVVDDDRKIVRLVRSYLEQAGMAVLTAYEGDTAMHVIRHERPDLIVLDLMLPGHDGWEITRWLRSDEHLAAIPIIMLTARVEDGEKIRGLNLGADDYLTKPFNPDEVVARVRAVLRRTRADIQTSRVIQSGRLRLDVGERAVTLNSQPIAVTPTEFALLSALMEHPDHTFTRDELIEQALGYNYEGLERTLDSHIKNIRKKIEDDPAQPRYIETVFGVGYRFREQEL
jgi:two-component system alkaline phosphatase synthesis response regulator PhoP